MNTFVCIGRVASAPVAKNNKPGDPARTEFFVISAARVKPLRFFCTSIGKNAERALGFAEGEMILLTGRLEPAVIGGGAFRVAVLVNTLEKVTTAAKDLDLATQREIS